MKIQYFIVLEAYGTGALSSTKIVVQGYLPNYNIAVYDRELKGSSMFNTSGQGSVALLGRLVSEGIFKDILKISNNLFGINRVGVEPSPGGGVFRVGKRFNDRIEVSYIANVNETTENRVSGDYKFLDWFKMSIFSTAKGGQVRDLLLALIISLIFAANVMAVEIRGDVDDELKTKLSTYIELMPEDKFSELLHNLDLSIRKKS